MLRVKRFLNKWISRTSKIGSRIRGYVLIKGILFTATIFNCFSHKREKYVQVEALETKLAGDIVLNCTGCIALGGHIDQYCWDIEGVLSILENADLTFTSVRYRKKNKSNFEQMREILKEYRIEDVSHSNCFMQSKIYCTEQGKFAVISYRRNSAIARKRHARLDLTREILMLKRLGAEYVIVYIDEQARKTVSEKTKKFCATLLKLGADYVVGVNPAACDSGVTHMQRDRSVSRAVFSLGTFIGTRKVCLDHRAIIRLKLRRVNGKLQAFEEAYFPLRYMKDCGLKNLIDEENDENDIRCLAAIEKCMPRLRSVDKIITVGKLVEIVGAELPEKFNYIKDFSVGRISAKGGAHQAGDVYVRWPPHTEVNDKDTYKMRVKAAKRLTKKAAKTDLFIISYKEFPIKAPYVVVDTGLEAHVAIGAYLRSQHSVRCVAITGSIGKTSTKDMLAEVMKQKYNTVKSAKNENVHSKISLSLQRITSDCEVYIQELGGGRPGGASRHSRMVLPEATVVTNIGDAHIGNFDGDKEALMHNKLGIIDGMPEYGVIYLNGDDPLLVNAHPDCKKVLYAVHNKNADYYAEDIIEKDDKLYFNIVHEEHRVPVCLNVPGEHNVLNAVCCFAIGKQFDVAEEQIVNGLANFRTEGIRQHIEELCGMKLFLDCYNASSGSIESSIKTLTHIEKPAHGKHIAVIGDITGLGDLTESAHKEIADVLIENPVDLIILRGKSVKYTHDALAKKGCNAFYAPNEKQLNSLLQETARPGDVIMVKGSSKMKLEYAFDCAFGTRFFDETLLDENAYYRATVDGVVYNLFNTHATAVKPKNRKKYVKIKTRIGGVEVHNIGSTFRSTTLENVSFQKTIRHIGAGAFRDCTKLEKIGDTSGLMFIGQAAFQNCSALKEIKLPEGLRHIGESAFAGCLSLKELFIPQSVAQIGENAFQNCPELKISCKAGSYADAYLNKYNISHRCV